MDDGSISFELARAFNEAMGNICPVCGGSGKVKAMQRMALFGGGSVRGPDTKINCPHCGGTGKVRKEKD